MDTIYAMLKQTFLLTKHFLNWKQKCETWSDTCSRSAGLSWPRTQEFHYDGAHSLSLLRKERSHTLYLKWGLFQRLSEEKVPSLSVLSSCCCPLFDLPLFFPKPWECFHLVSSIQLLILHLTGTKGLYLHHAWSPEAWSAGRTFASSAQNCWDT